jgi:hypothetical protein
MKRKIIGAVLVLASVTIAGACRRNQPPNSSAAPGGNASTLPAPGVSNALPSPAPVIAQATYFNGSIGDNNGLEMKLIREGDKLSGSYYYQKIGTAIGLKGTIDKDGNVAIDEFDPAGKQTGTFKGIWKSDLTTGTASIAGNWSKPNSDKKTAFSIHQQPIEFASGTEIVAKQIKENNKKLNYTVEVGYPEIKTALDTRFDKFNVEAKNVAGRMVAAFKKEQGETAKDDTGATTTSELTSTFSGSYRIAMANDSLISMRYDFDGYMGGAAHGGESSAALNYDLKSGKVLKLADLFTPGAKYVSVISAYCITDLKRQSKATGDSLPDDMIKVGAAPNAQNFQSWTITRKGLQIAFDPYQVGPYAAGPQIVLVPYAALKDLIKPDGALAAFAK